MSPLWSTTNCLACSNPVFYRDSYCDQCAEAIWGAVKPRPDCGCGHPASYHINFVHEGKPIPPGPPDIPRKKNFCRHPMLRGFCGCRDYSPRPE